MKGRSGCCHLLQTFAACLLTCLQQVGTAVIEDALTAVEGAVEQLPNESQLQRNAVTAVEAIEEVISPQHLAEKRLKRKQQKARYAVAPPHVADMSVVAHHAMYLNLLCALLTGINKHV